MASLEWRSDATEKQQQHPSPTHHSIASAKTGDPWFPAAMGLLGLVIGYLIGS